MTIAHNYFPTLALGLTCNVFSKYLLKGLLKFGNSDKLAMKLILEELKV